MKQIFIRLAVIFQLLFGAAVMGFAQFPVIINSHNDYNQAVPFYQAYSQKVQSIEIDLFLKDGLLIVGHDFENLKEYDTFDRLYVEPVKSLFVINGGRAWKDSNNRLQFLVEIKSDSHTTMQKLVDTFAANQEVFDMKINPYAVKIVVTGNIPPQEDFVKYPEYICFDGDINKEYTVEQLKRVSMFSEDFSNFSHWNGKGSLIAKEQDAIERVIAKSHSLGKPIRFWNAPEGMTAYYTFYNLGIDYINTDKPEACVEFFSDFSNKNFIMGRKSEMSERITSTKKLDRITNDFEGFSDNKLQLSKSIDIYNPAYINDGTSKKIKNVIMLIGDGMGLNQIAAGYYANNGLSLMKMRNIGFQINNAIDAFTTDSAAGGSALATGKSHANRHISMTVDGKVIPTLSDYFHNMNKAVGVLSLGNVADATPAAFYGHATDRDSADLILSYLNKAEIDLLCGSGIDLFEKNRKKEELSRKYNFVTDISGINEKKGKVICIDEKMGDAAEEANITLLSDALRQSVQKLQSLGDNGFFLMAEGAKIDYAGHSRCLPGSILEMLSFDLAVAQAMKFADSNGETLVIVTADHETGGLVIVDGDIATGRVTGVYFSDDHTPSIIPVFAYGPGSENFRGVYKNTEIARTVKSLIK